MARKNATKKANKRRGGETAVCYDDDAALQQFWSGSDDGGGGLVFSPLTHIFKALIFFSLYMALCNEFNVVGNTQTSFYR